MTHPNTLMLESSKANPLEDVHAIICGIRWQRANPGWAASSPAQ
jgi:hypothetical protein